MAARETAPQLSAGRFARCMAIKSWPWATPPTIRWSSSFLRLLRGAGPGVLKGMWPATPEGVVLGAAFGGGQGPSARLVGGAGHPLPPGPQQPKPAYLRNRVRLDLLPELLRLYNPRLREAVWRGQVLLQEDERLLAGETGTFLGRGGRCPARGFYYLDLGRLRAGLPLAVAGAPGRGGEGGRGGGAHRGPETGSLLDLAQGKKSGGLISLGQLGRPGPAGRLHLFRDLPPVPGRALALPEAPEGNLESPEGWRWTWSSRPHPGPDFTPPGFPGSVACRERRRRASDRWRGRWSMRSCAHRAPWNRPRRQ